MATSKPVSFRPSDDVREALDEFTEEREITNGDGDLSQGKALDQLAKQSLAREGYIDWIDGESESDVSLYYEGGKVCFGVVGGLLVAQLSNPAVVNFHPHIIGFLVAGSATLLLDRWHQRHSGGDE